VLPASAKIGASGLQWSKADPAKNEKPDEGEELTDAALSTALDHQTDFTSEQWEAFGIAGLRKDHFVCSASGVYYVPTEDAFLGESSLEEKLVEQINTTAQDAMEHAAEAHTPASASVHLRISVKDVRRPPIAPSRARCHMLAVAA
jgi:hypothetical protein